MAFPYVHESNFEQGTNAEWDSESDTGSLLDFPHVSTLAAQSATGIGSNAIPFRGAYCMRIRLGDTNDHTLTEGDHNISANAAAYVRFYMLLGNDFAFTADDVFNIYEAQASSTVEAAIGLRVTATTGAIEIGVGETAPTVFGGPNLIRNKWYAIEALIDVDNAGSNDGAVTLYVDGQQYATVGSLDQGAITDGVFGTQNTLASTTGTMLFDQFVFDDTRIYPIVDRYPMHFEMTKSGHVFVGPGIIDNISLQAGAGTDNVLTIYDTNRGNTNDALKVGVELKNVTNSDIVDPAGMPVKVTRGAYVSLTGTNPRAMVNIHYAAAYGSSGAVRAVATRLKTNPLEVL